MKKIIALLVVVSLMLLSIVLAYDPNYPILDGRIRNVCGGFENDPNCVNTCVVETGSCYAPPGYTVSVYKCKGISMRPGTNDYECINLPGYNFIYGEFGKSSASLANYVEPCTTIQIDVVDANGVGRDWIVWVSNKQSPSDCNVCPYQSTEARFHTEEDGTLRKYLEVYLGTKVKAVGTHNQQAVYWSDTLLTITGPNNFVFNCESQCWFTPPYVGVYTLKVTTEGYSGPNCEDTATLVVKSIPPTTIPRGSLKIFKFDDRNGNGIWESGERGLSGFRFTIEGPISKTVYTNADGYVLESNLPYGVYKITESVPEGWEVTTLNPQYVTINSPELKEVKFGNRQVPVSTPPCTTTTVCHQPCYEPEDISVGSVEISPYTICREKDTSIEISVPVRLAAGKDNTEVTARFYVKEDGRYIYIGKTTHILDVGEKRTFTLQYDYNAYDLSYGTHDVKIVVEGRKDSETRYSAIRVVRCLEPKDIEVGFIYLNPENPRSSDLVEGRVPITLKEAPSLPQNVYVEVRIDGKVLTESSLRFYHIETKDYKFYFNADKYGQGTHTIEVTAWIDGISDTSMRRFIIDETSYFRTTPEHCLIIKDFWTDNPLKEGESAVIKMRVRNCGMHVETNIQSRLYILNKTMSGGIISLRPNEERDIAFTIRVPEDIDGVKAKVNVWNSYASDEVEKEFAVKMGYPYVKAEKDYRVMRCQQNNISFIVKNVGQVKDTFTLTIEGEPAKWISGYPRMIELEPEETKKIYVDVNVPCDAKGVYQFTITAQGSPKYSVTSNLIVAKRPFDGLSALSDLLWVILLLLLLLFILFLLMSMKRRNKKPERCMGPHGC